MIERVGYYLLSNFQSRPTSVHTQPDWLICWIVFQEGMDSRFVSGSLINLSIGDEGKFGQPSLHYLPLWMVIHVFPIILEHTASVESRMSLFLSQQLFSMLDGTRHVIATVSRA